MSDSGCGGDWEGNSSRRARFSSLPALHARLRLRGAERRGAGAGRRDMVCPATLRRQVFGGKLCLGSFKIKIQVVWEDLLVAP